MFDLLFSMAVLGAGLMLWLRILAGNTPKDFFSSLIVDFALVCVLLSEYYVVVQGRFVCCD